MDNYGLPHDGDVQVWWPTDMIGNGVLIMVNSISEGLRLMKAFEEYDKRTKRTCYVESVVPAEMYVYVENQTTKDHPYLGTGWVEWKKVANQVECPVCGGSGCDNNEVCSNCIGRGKV